MAIAVSDELKEKGTQGLHSRVCQVGVLPASHRASRYALETRGMAIAVSDELHEREGPGTNRALTGL